MGADDKIAAGCSKSPFSKAAASEGARRTLRYVEPLSDARTPLADFFSILLDASELAGILKPPARVMAGQWKKGAIPPKWDGKAAERIVECLERVLVAQ